PLQSISETPTTDSTSPAIPFHTHLLGRCRSQPNLRTDMPFYGKIKRRNSLTNFIGKSDFPAAVSIHASSSTKLLNTLRGKRARPSVLPPPAPVATMAPQVQLDVGQSLTDTFSLGEADWEEAMKSDVIKKGRFGRRTENIMLEAPIPAESVWWGASTDSIPRTVSPQPYKTTTSVLKTNGNQRTLVVTPSKEVPPATEAYESCLDEEDIETYEALRLALSWGWPEPPYREDSTPVIQQSASQPGLSHSSSGMTMLTDHSELPSTPKDMLNLEMVAEGKETQDETRDVVVVQL
ncbi:hypothetical protein P7C73_g5084, partial [Tremellales sp. Uapishka_1]